MLKITALRKSFGERRILDGLDLALARGQYVAVIGESGAGKSTLLNLIAGLEPADGGRIEIAGQVMVDVPQRRSATPSPLLAGEGRFVHGATDLTDDQRTALRRAQLGFVFQAFHILPHLTVAQNVMLPLVLLGMPQAERETRTQAMLAAVGLGDRGASAPRELSGGELQRVAIARALVHKPQLVLADEPTGNLDPDTAAPVLALLAREIRSRGAAGILVTHSQQAARTADRVLRLEHGRLTEVG
jgi:putative ABC transport system ATP-binding protein